VRSFFCRFVLPPAAVVACAAALTARWRLSGRRGRAGRWWHRSDVPLQALADLRRALGRLDSTRYPMIISLASAPSAPTSSPPPGHPGAATFTLPSVLRIAIPFRNCSPPNQASAVAPREFRPTVSRSFSSMRARTSSAQRGAMRQRSPSTSSTISARSQKPSPVCAAIRSIIKPKTRRVLAFSCGNSASRGARACVIAAPFFD
jgi:hypothetical protein